MPGFDLISNPLPVTATNVDNTTPEGIFSQGGNKKAVTRLFFAKNFFVVFLSPLPLRYLPDHTEPV
jgi:hypothetical protein